MWLETSHGEVERAWSCQYTHITRRQQTIHWFVEYEWDGRNWSIETKSAWIGRAGRGHQAWTLGRPKRDLTAHANPLFDAMIDQVTISAPSVFHDAKESQNGKNFRTKISDVYRIMSIARNAASLQMQAFWYLSCLSACTDIPANQSHSPRKCPTRNEHETHMLAGRRGAAGGRQQVDTPNPKCRGELLISPSWPWHP